MLNNGDGTFAATLTDSVPTPSSILMADFNGDGKLDIAAGSPGDIYILLGTGTGTFSSSTPYTINGDSPFGLTTADLNGDGFLDLATANTGSWNTSVLLGNGSGAFSAPIMETVGIQPNSATSGDFNSDGKPDLAIANFYPNNVSVLLSFAPASLVITPSSTLACSGQAVTLSVSGADTYTWSTGSNDASIAVSPTTTTTYSVTGATASGCTTTQTISIGTSTATPPAVSISAADTSLCLGDTATLTASGASNYSWAGLATGAVYTDMPFATTVYSVTGYASNGCSDTKTISISVDQNSPSLTLSIAASNTLVCATQTLTLTASGADTYLWGNSSTSPVITDVPTVSGTYSVTGTSLAGCSATTSIYITVNHALSPPAISIASPSSTVCVGQHITLTASGASAYVWSNTGSAAPTFTDYVYSNTIYTVTGMAANGCTATQTTSIHVIDSLSAPFMLIGASNYMLCGSQSSTITAFGAGTYSWSTSSTSPSIVVSPTVTTGYTVTGTDPNGCTNSIDIEIAVSNTLTPPSITIYAADTTLCAGQALMLSASGAGSYLWNNNTSGPVLTFYPDSSAVYSVTGTDMNGCSNTQTISIAVMDSLHVPTLNLSASRTSACLGQTVTITASGDPASYLWGTGDVTSSVVETILMDTAYFVTATAANGCTSTQSVSISLDDPHITFAATQTAVCVGSQVIITASGVSTYTWSTVASSSNVITVTPTVTTTYSVAGMSAGGCFTSNSVGIYVDTNLVAPVVLVGATNTVVCANVAANLFASGAVSYVWNTGATTDSTSVTSDSTQAFIVTGTAANGCRSSSSILITVLPIPVISITGGTGNICPGLGVALSAGGASSYTWNTGENTASVNETPAPSSSSHDVSYSVTGTDLNGCTGNGSTTVHVLAPMSVSTGGSDTVCVGSSINLYTLYANTYTWSTGDTTSYINVLPLVNTTYSVAVADTNGCSSTLTITIAVDTTCQDVWPGDANSDGIVDNLDFLELGLHMSQTGPARMDSLDNWAAHHASNWTGTITNGKNLSHSDCNGDGVIDPNDTLQIYAYYNYTHVFKPWSQNTVDPVLSIVQDQAAVQKGHWGTASIYMGTATAPVANVNGTAFTIAFDSALVQRDSVYIEYPSSFLNAGNHNLKFSKADTLGFIYAATTHTNNVDVSGSGKIAILHFKVNPSLTSDAPLNFNMTQAYLANASGSVSTVAAGSSSTTAVGGSVGIEELNASTLTAVYPNPASDMLNVASTVELQKIELLSLTGQVVVSEQATGRQHQVQLGNLAPGIYFISVYSDNHIIKREKIVVER